MKGDWINSSSPLTHIHYLDNHETIFKNNDTAKMYVSTSAVSREGNSMINQSISDNVKEQYEETLYGEISRMVFDQESLLLADIPVKLREEAANIVFTKQSTSFPIESDVMSFRDNISSDEAQEIAMQDGFNVLTTLHYSDDFQKHLNSAAQYKRTRLIEKYGEDALCTFSEPKTLPVSEISVPEELRSLFVYEEGEIDDRCRLLGNRRTADSTITIENGIKVVLDQSYNLLFGLFDLTAAKKLDATQIEVYIADDNIIQSTPLNTLLFLSQYSSQFSLSDFEMLQLILKLIGDYDVIVEKDIDNNLLIKHKDVEADIYVQAMFDVSDSECLLTLAEMFHCDVNLVSYLTKIAATLMDVWYWNNTQKQSDTISIGEMPELKQLLCPIFRNTYSVFGHIWDDSFFDTLSKCMGSRRGTYLYKMEDFFRPIYTA